MIFHIPHSSTSIPEDHRMVFKIDAGQLKRELISMTDAFTDELFGAHATASDSQVVFPVSRLVLDPERFLNDQDEPMSEIGMGVIYTRTSNGEVLRDPPHQEDRERLIRQYYEPHHLALTRAVENEIQNEGRALIIDCHSFPSKALPYEKDQAPNRPDICIGVDEFHSEMDLYKGVSELIEKLGWTYAVNRPFSGTIVPIEFYRKDKRVSSIMVEVNRRLYLDEVSGEKSIWFDDCLKRIGLIVAGIRQLKTYQGT